MKIIYLFSISSLLMMAGIKASAQEVKSVKPFEVEISAGGTYGSDKYVGKNGSVLLLPLKADIISHKIQWT